jgi:2-polyprenyl-3-methyl-5-hydroxy-6-metoxy-1,4-benzoquinol methylase
MDANAYRKERINHWNEVALSLGKGRNLGESYFQRLVQIYRFNIPEGMRVLELGCGQGDLLAALKPARGVGIDFSSEMARRACELHPELCFFQADVHDFEINEKFDFVILSDLVNDLWDVQTVLDKVRKVCEPNTRIIINTYSRLWELPLKFGEWIGQAKPVLNQNWLEVKDVNHFLILSGFESLRTWAEYLEPFPIPLLQPLCNRYLVKLGIFGWMALTNFIIARPSPERVEPDPLPKVTVVVPARNEAGNIASILQRVPEMGSGTEIVFVEGHSSDQTFESIQQQVALHPEKTCQVFRQTGKGKGDAVRLGFKEATGDILMILDADLTVPPEDLPRFYSALVSQKGEFINGIRLVYPMEDQAMKFFNFMGNKFFSITFSWLLGQPIKDTLCGTKVLWKKDYQKIAKNRSYFGDFDPFGDFDLLFGASRLNLKIVDLPIRYKERTYGQTNIQRWKHGLLLLQMVLFAANRIKFI